jgi:hypothetical protein
LANSLIIINECLSYLKNNQNKEMALLKVTDKHSNLRLKFEHPIVLNPEKKYKLGVTHLMFSVDTAMFISFRLDIVILSKEISTGFTMAAAIDRKTTINYIREYLKKGINDAYNCIIHEYEMEGRKDIANKLKKEFSTKPSFKFYLKKEYD